MDADERRCSAVTKAGVRCKNTAQTGATYCYVHRHWVQAPQQAESAQPAPSANRTVTPRIEGTNPADVQLHMLMHQLSALGREFQRWAPDATPASFTPAQLLDLSDKTLDRYLPAAQRELLQELRRNLSDATLSDLVDPDVWKGMWYILNYSVQSRSLALKENLAGRLAALPGASLLVELRNNLQGTTPKDLIDPGTWKGLLYILNYTAQHQLFETTRRILRTTDREQS